jgi:hypothetical protein
LAESNRQYAPTLRPKRTSPSCTAVLLGTDGERVSPAPSASPSPSVVDFTSA